MRLDRLFSAVHGCSRSQAAALMRACRVQVNGGIAKSPSMNVSPKDEITLDGCRLDTRLSRHYMLYKPSGLLTASEDGRQETVMKLLPPVCRTLGCMPVGRLDKDTTGILIFTTDGELAHRLLSPKRHVDKVYEALVDGCPDESDVQAFQEGVRLKDFTALPATLEIIGENAVRVTVREGKYHQIKRMLGARGLNVLALKRLSFGPIPLDERLSAGECRELTAREVAALYDAADMPHE